MNAFDAEDPECRPRADLFYLTNLVNKKHKFSINVWAGMIDDLVIGPYVLPNRLNQDTFLEFLPVLLEDLPLATRQVMWFQLDGAPAHFGRSVRTFLNTHYPQWIGRGGRIAWPPRSPDLGL